MLVCGEGKGQSPPWTWGDGVGSWEEEEEAKKGKGEEEPHPGVSTTQEHRAVHLKVARFHAMQTAWLKALTKPLLFSQPVFMEHPQCVKPCGKPSGGRAREYMLHCRQSPEWIPPQRRKGAQVQATEGGASDRSSGLGR